MNTHLFSFHNTCLSRGFHATTEGCWVSRFRLRRHVIFEKLKICVKKDHAKTGGENGFNRCWSAVLEAQQRCPLILNYLGPRSSRNAHLHH